MASEAPGRERICATCARTFFVLDPHALECMRCRARFALAAPVKRATTEEPPPLKDEDEEEECEPSDPDGRLPELTP